jgi:hypothetical protein
MAGWGEKTGLGGEMLRSWAENGGVWGKVRSCAKNGGKS